MADYSCQCPGPFRTARYTVADAVRMNFYCQRCKSQIIQLNSYDVSKFDEEDVDDVQVAPGANSNSEAVQAILERENGVRKHRNAKLEQVIQNLEQEAAEETARKIVENDEVPEVEKAPELPKTKSEILRDIVFGTPGPKDPDVRIRYANGVQYRFDWDDFDDPTEDVIRQFQRFTNSWTQRKNYALVLKARGRWWLLNAELVAGIDYKD